ncbi:hypothetical protein [Pollutimonas thiosulfatoxidans]|uniref:Uncharacterized protein n=1 Tax=Pollutimonas thiosulfatoxidans TaxID=2028345 RepID=A0A410GF34_9BURK|nr:hypothetical protein [Pollutimonas thiosulfatoxidans]QAA94912.1 hypothetical protein CKA81_14410 [Pollutimonas thiosulfatoxidans]
MGHKTTPVAGDSLEDSWSPELRQHIEVQLGFWLAMIKVIESNNQVLGTSAMVSYSTEEREQLKIMGQHMQELAMSVGPHRGEQVLLLRKRLQDALDVYDDFPAALQKSA